MGYLGFREALISPGRLPNWKIPEPEEISRIQIRSPEGSDQLILEKSDSSWYLPQIRRQAGEESVNNLLTRISNLRPVNVLSRRGPYEPFGLKKPFSIEISGPGYHETFYGGNLNGTENYTYFRRKGESAVVSVRGNWEKIASFSPEDFRSRQILDFSPEILKGLVFIRGDQFSLWKKGSETWTGVGETPEWDSRKIESFLKRLSRLQCLQLVEPDQSITEPLLTIQIQKQNGTDSLELIKKEEQGYIASVGGEPDFFLISQYDGDFLREMSGLF